MKLSSILFSIIIISSTIELKFANTDTLNENFINNFDFQNINEIIKKYKVYDSYEKMPYLISNIFDYQINSIKKFNTKFNEKLPIIIDTKSNIIGNLIIKKLIMKVNKNKNIYKLSISIIIDNDFAKNNLVKLDIIPISLDLSNSKKIKYEIQISNLELVKFKGIKINELNYFDHFLASNIISNIQGSIFNSYQIPYTNLIIDINKNNNEKSKLDNIINNKGIIITLDIKNDKNDNIFDKNLEFKNKINICLKKDYLNIVLFNPKSKILCNNFS